MIEARSRVEGTPLSSFEDFYASNFDSVYRAVFVATGDEDGSLEATQEAFKRAFVRWRRLSQHDWAGGWTMTTALNVYRRSHRRRDFSVYEVNREQEPIDPTSRLDVVDALRTLPPRQQTATVLYYLGDIPVAAIADLMNVAEGTVKAHLAQARTSLRHLLEVSDV
jgi:RNA polymerase sigma-70 factor, ECF subfamily